MLLYPIASHLIMAEAVFDEYFRSHNDLGPEAGEEKACKRSFLDFFEGYAHLFIFHDIVSTFDGVGYDWDLRMDVYFETELINGDNRRDVDMRIEWDGIGGCSCDWPDCFDDIGKPTDYYIKNIDGEYEKVFNVIFSPSNGGFVTTG